jgi:hypothetical protein
MLDRLSEIRSETEVILNEVKDLESGGRDRNSWIIPIPIPCSLFPALIKP